MYAYSIVIIAIFALLSLPLSPSSGVKKNVLRREDPKAVGFIGPKPIEHQDFIEPS